MNFFFFSSKTYKVQSKYLSIPNIDLKLWKILSGRMRDVISRRKTFLYHENAVAPNRQYIPQPIIEQE